MSLGPDLLLEPAHCETARFEDLALAVLKAARAKELHGGRVLDVGSGADRLVHQDSDQFGRGLLLVGSLSHHWGWEPRSAGKTVYAEWVLGPDLAVGNPLVGVRE
ncbi:ATP-binding protein [Streptomyces galilaeus]